MKKSKLDAILRDERSLYLGEDINRIRQMKKSRNRRYLIWCYLVAFRKCQYWKTVRENKNVRGLQKRFSKLCYHYYDKKRNLLSGRCGVEIGINSRIGRNLDIWHGGIVINGELGDDCVLHGNNIIGNKGKGRESEFPVIGNGVDIGAGANIIGKLYLAHNTIVGSGAVVTKSFEETGSVLVGIPARRINIKEEI